MKSHNLRRIAFAVLCGAMALTTFGQKPLNKSKQTLALVMTEDPGASSGSVAHDAERKRYYAVLGTEAGSIVEAFDEEGAAQGAIPAGADLHGLWFYPETGEVEANAKGENGWLVLPRDAKGTPTGDAEPVFEGMLQPEAASAGCYDPVKKCIAFFSKGVIHLYERTSGEPHQKIKLSEDVKQAGLNTLHMGCTGVAGYDYALLDYQAGKVILLDRKGQPSGDVALPKGVATSATQGFAVANGHAWLYQSDSHSWLGFPLFE